MNKIILNDLEEIYHNTNIDYSLFDNKTILITGAYGMLASYLTYFFMYLHDYKNVNLKLICLVRNIEKYYKKFDEKIFVRVIENDLSKEMNINEKVDYIIHAASLASPQYYEICPVDVLNPNVIGNYNLLNLAVKNKVQGYLLFSSCDVYGYVDNKIKIDENTFGYLDTLDIHNCYSESKRMSETMCKAYYVQYGVPCKIARIAHTYAPTMDIKNDPRVFASFVKNVVNNENIVIKSDGNGRRAFCYITDAISAYLMILIKGKAGEAYNVSNDTQYISIKELAETLVNIYPNKNLKVVFKQRSKDEHYSENILLKDHEQVPVSNKLKSIGWEPRISVKEGFKRIIDCINE